MAEWHLPPRSCQYTSSRSRTPPEKVESNLLLSTHMRIGNPSPGALCQHEVEIIYNLRGQILYKRRWLVPHLPDHVASVHIHSVIGNDCKTDTWPKCQGSLNPSMFFSAPNVGGTHLNLTAEETTLNFKEFNKQHQQIAEVVSRG